MLDSAFKCALAAIREVLYLQKFLCIASVWYDLFFLQLQVLLEEGSAVSQPNLFFYDFSSLINI